MISARQIDLRKYSYRECWQLAPGLTLGLELILRNLLNQSFVVQRVNCCREDVTQLEEHLFPLKLKKICREVADGCAPNSLRLLVCSFPAGLP